MNNISRKAILIIAAALTAAISLRGGRRCDIEVFTTNDGLSSNMISCVEQDNDGLLWFGTWNGLCCFDGYRFIPFGKEQTKGEFPRNNRIQFIKPAAPYRLWCVTYDRRLYLFDIPTATFTDVSAVIERKIGDTFLVRNIYAPTDNTLYATCYNSEPYLFSIDITDSGDINVSNHYLRYCSGGETVYEVERTDNGAIRIFTSAPDDMATVWENGVAVNTIEADSLRRRKTYHTDSKGRLWMVGDSVLLNGRRVNYASVSENFSPATVKLPLFIDQADGSVWLAAKNSPLGYFDESSQTIVPYQLDDGVSQNQNLTALSKWFVDSDNNIWSITQHNLTRITPSQSPVDFHPLHRGEDVRAIEAAGGQGFIFQGRFDSSAPYSLLTDSRGRRWEGYKNSGLYMNDSSVTSDKADRHFTNLEGSLAGHEVFDIFEDSHGRIWAACYDAGLNLYDEDSGEFLQNGQGLPEFPKGQFHKVRHINETPDGIMLLATADGLVAFSSDFNSPSEIRYTTYSATDSAEGLSGGNVMDVSPASDGRIYLSTMSGALLSTTSDGLLEGKAKFQVEEPTARGAGIIQSFVEDNNGALWLARENMLQRYIPATGQITDYGRNYFGVDYSFTEALPRFNATTGEVAMGVAGGIITFRPAQMDMQSRTPAILFTQLHFQGEDYSVPILYADHIDVPADKRNLSVSFAALNYSDNSLIRYAYMLEGVDTDWHYLDEGHTASFNNLPPGESRLLVKSTNADGVWADNVSVLVINAERRFSETIWAKLLYAAAALIIIIVIIYIVRLRRRRAAERIQMEQKLQALMLRLSDSRSDFAAQAFVVGQAEPSTAPSENAPLSSADSKLMERVMVYIDAHVADSNLKIQDIAGAACMSRSAFNDRLKNITGMSPADFLRYLRLQRACKLIAETDLTFSQIAYATGFSDPNYFSKAFRHSKNMSPSEYRRLHHI